MNESTPDLSTPEGLARWALAPLVAAGAERRMRWRQLEPWWQVELFASLTDQPADDWRSVGEFELPYATQNMPRKKKNTAGIKWIDLALVRGETALFIELKDMGLNPDRVLPNAYHGAGKDLVALSSLDWQKTLDQLRAPSDDVKDAGRKAEFDRAAEDLGRCRTLLRASVFSQRIVSEKRSDVESRARAAVHAHDRSDAESLRGAECGTDTVCVRVLMLPPKSIAAP